MRITVKLFATLREGRGKEQILEVAEGLTVDSVLELLNVKRKDVAILLINGKDGRFGANLSQGDTLSLFPPVGGG